MRLFGKIFLALALTIASIAPSPLELPRPLRVESISAGIGQWKIVDLTGTKNGSNVTFTIPDTPDLQTLLIVFNGLPLHRVVSAPGVLQYTISGTTITLGLAPGANDRVWANYDIA
jgi:hypothetical protein